MEGLILLILLFIVVFVVVMPITAAVKAGGAAQQARDAQQRIARLEQKSAWQEQEIRELRGLLEKAGPAPASAPQAEPAAAPGEDRAADMPAPEAVVLPPLMPPPDQVFQPLPAAETPPATAAEVSPAEIRLPALAKAAQAAASKVASGPPPMPPVGPAAESAPPPPPRVPVSLEQFLGVKLFAWLGGIALFFGVIFFVKYAFEHNLIPPAARVAIGFVAGVGLLVGGLWTHRKPAYRVLAQSLCATGVLILYGVSFAAHAVYRFPAFGPGATFALMSLITVAAFLVAVRLDALVVAALGMVGGFLTPVLLPMARDNPFALFSYIALLDAGLLAVTWRGRWRWLATAAAAGTAMMQIGWVAEHFVDGRYFEGAATLVPMGISLLFAALFLAVAWRTAGTPDDNLHPPGSALGMLGLAMGFGFFFLFFPGISDRVLLLYGYVLLLNLGAIALAWACPRFHLAQTAFAAATFLHLAVWTVARLKPELLGSALAAYLVLGGLHAVWPVLAARRRPAGGVPLEEIPRRVAVWLPALLVGLMALTLLVLPEAPFLLWPAVLLADLLAIALAVACGALWPVLAVLGMTLLTAVVWLFRVPAEIVSLPPLLGVVLFFSLFFTAAGMWLAKRLPGQAEREPAMPWDPSVLLPAASGAMPFLLLVLMVLQLPVANPAPVLGAALLLALLLLGIALFARQSLLAPVALLCCLAVEGVWHGQRFDPANVPGVALACYLVFYALFTGFPFLFRKACQDHAEPWIASALSGAGHFVLVHDLVRRAFPNDMMGLLPAAFAVPAILALLAVRRAAPAMDRAAQTRLAWFGGVALLFITLIFPIQFDRQWLTVSWALEGACLVWLFRRIPHPGLLWTGLALLAVSFVRLALNPAVLDSYPRSGTAILNWHLYAYGIVAAAQFLAAWWLPAEWRRFQKLNLRGTLWTLGGVLLFLLLNIEIADFFTEPGARFIAFEFAGNFARDMTYTIAWGLFALALLVIGIWRHGKGARLTAIALLVLTLAKLFLHDLATIGNIYRVAALVGVGLIAFVASFLYQRFFASSSKP